MSAAAGKIGWWSPRDDSLAGGQAFADGQPVRGDRTLRIVYGDERSTADPAVLHVPHAAARLLPRADPARHVELAGGLSAACVPQCAGEKEQMSVGVAQNAVDNRLATMCEPGAKGRSFHGGATVSEPDAVLHGYNVAEQWERALQEDPRFIFVTGWNEWIRRPVRRVPRRAIAGDVRRPVRSGAQPRHRADAGRPRRQLLLPDGVVHPALQRRSSHRRRSRRSRSRSTGSSTTGHRGSRSFATRSTIRCGAIMPAMEAPGRMSTRRAATISWRPR